MADEKRLIDANVVLARLKTDIVLGECEKAFLRNFVNNAPTVDAVEVVHGEWIGIQYDGYADGCPVYDLWECSECREEYETEGDPPPYNYCPNCGAKMDGERKDNGKKENDIG